MNNTQTVSREEEYRRLDNRVTCIPAALACQRDLPVGGDAAGQTAGRGLRHPAPSPSTPIAAGPAGHRHRGAEPVQAKSSRPTVPVLTARWPLRWPPPYRGRAHPVAIDQSGTIRCAVTGRTLFIARVAHRPRQPGCRRTAQPNIPANPAPGSG